MNNILASTEKGSKITERTASCTVEIHLKFNSITNPESENSLWLDSGAFEEMKNLFKQLFQNEQQATT